MDIENKVLTINDRKYLVIETVELDNKKYVYLVNKTDEMDSMFREIKFTETLTINKIDPILFQEKIYPLFIEKFKSY